MPLAPHCVDVFITDPADADAPELRARYFELLTPEERARHDRFMLDHVRHAFLVTRALVRTALSRYAEVSPDAWRFDAGANGRPFVREPACPVDFNLSHTDGMIVCAISTAATFGIDVENTARGRAWSLMDDVFSPREARALRELGDDAQRRARFFDLWTLKEAYIKARGLGLAIGLDTFTFELATEREIEIQVDDPSDNASAWQFALYDASDQHRAAVAVRAGPGSRPIELTFHRSVPLAGVETTRWTLRRSTRAPT